MSSKKKTNCTVKGLKSSCLRSSLELCNNISNREGGLVGGGLDWIEVKVMEKDGTFHDLGIMQDRGRNATVVSLFFFFIKQMTRFVLSAGLVGWRFSLTNVAETILGRFKVFFSIEYSRQVWVLGHSLWNLSKNRHQNGEFWSIWRLTFDFINCIPFFFVSKNIFLRQICRQKAISIWFITGSNLFCL